MAISVDDHHFHQHHFIRKISNLSIPCHQIDRSCAFCIQRISEVFNRSLVYIAHHWHRFSFKQQNYSPRLHHRHVKQTYPTRSFQILLLELFTLTIKSIMYSFLTPLSTSIIAVLLSKHWLLSLIYVFSSLKLLSLPCVLVSTPGNWFFGIKIDGFFYLIFFLLFILTA